LSVTKSVHAQSRVQTRTTSRVAKCTSPHGPLVAQRHTATCIKQNVHTVTFHSKAHTQCTRLQVLVAHPAGRPDGSSRSRCDCCILTWLWGSRGLGTLPMSLAPRCSAALLHAGGLVGGCRCFVIIGLRTSCSVTGTLMSRLRQHRRRRLWCCPADERTCGAARASFLRRCRQSAAVSRGRSLQS